MSDLYGTVNLIETTVITPEGEIEKVWRVTARSRSGVQFSVDVKAAELESARVDKILAKKAKEIEAIKGL